MLFIRTGQTVGRAIRQHQSAVVESLNRNPRASELQCLEVIDLETQTVSKLRIPPNPDLRPTPGWLVSRNGCDLMLDATTSTDEEHQPQLVTMDLNGFCRMYELERAALASQLADWHSTMFGSQRQDLELKVSDEDAMSKLDSMQGPKHGKTDPTGAPHVGGNTWAGGVGGRDTAGLGGVGGPYRLDGGNPVFQVSDAVKEAVPDEIKRAAREMGEKAFRERLRQIDMNEYDAEVYESIASPIRGSVKQLRNVIESVEAKSKERKWTRHQTHGDLDDSKVVDGVTGETSIYMRRTEQTPELGTPQEKPKRLRLVVDVSGSMYRFNGYDSRLDRELEATLLCMLALDGFEHKFKYDVHGHSGETYGVEFVSAESPPRNEQERLRVLQRMHAHSQFCASGDHTLEATRYACQQLADNYTDDDVDERIVIVLSDANLSRYSISARRFSSAMRTRSNTQAFAVFIGSLGDQADKLVEELPSGHAFTCFDTSKLPQIIKRIFASTLLRE